MADWSAKLKLPYMAAAQAQKHVTHNEALALLDAIVQLSVVSFDADTPPAVVVDGAVYALALAPTGVWAGQGGTLALASNGGWQFVTPQTGWRATLGLETRVWDGANWVAPPLPELQNLPGLGIGTSSSVGNPLAVAGEATLLTHAGAGHQLKINKAAAGDTASLLFQTNWSGRAEMGTAGNNDFAIKVSANGSLWTSAITALAATGGTRFGGAIEAKFGTAAAPGYSFDGDTDTGVYRAAANSLALATGGVQRALVTSAGISVSGLISGSAVQSSATDATTGRLMPVGGFGLGAISAPLCANLDDAALAAGLYRTSDSLTTAGTWPPSAPTGTARQGCLLVQRIDAASLWQTWWSLGEEAVWIRRYTATAWGIWRRTTRMVGTVSQTGGQATGAMIETGSNANGKYTRFADGTQICWFSFDAGDTKALGTGSFTDPYRSAGITWTFPAAFSTPPQGLASNCSTDSSGVGRIQYLVGRQFSALEATGMQVVRGSSASADSLTIPTTVQLVAIGRWY